MEPHPREQEELIRTLARKWRERGVGDEVLGCMRSKSPDDIISCCSSHLSTASSERIAPGIDLDHEALLHAQLGLAYGIAGNHAEAVEHYGNAARAFLICDHWSAAMVLLAQGRAYARMGLRAQALGNYAQSIKLLAPGDSYRELARAWQRELEEKPENRVPGPEPIGSHQAAEGARARRKAGLDFAQAGEKEKALAEYVAAANLLKRNGDPHLAGEYYETLGDEYYTQEQYSEAGNAYEMAIRMFEIARRNGRMRKVEGKLQQATRQSNKKHETSTLADADLTSQPVSGSGQASGDSGTSGIAANSGAPQEANPTPAETRSATLEEDAAGTAPGDTPLAAAGGESEETQAAMNEDAIEATNAERAGVRIDEHANVVPAQRVIQLRLLTMEQEKPIPDEPGLRPGQDGAENDAQNADADADDEAAAVLPQPVTPGARPEFTSLHLLLTPIEAERIAASPPSGAQLLIDNFVVATGIQIEGKSYSECWLLNGEDRLRLQSIDFALLVRGSSMAPTLLENDCVLVSKKAYKSSGAIVVARLQEADGEAYTIKRYRPRDRHVYLYPENKEFPSYAIVHDGEALAEVQRHYDKKPKSERPEIIIGPETVVEGVVIAILRPDPPESPQETVPATTGDPES